MHIFSTGFKGSKVTVLSKISFLSQGLCLKFQPKILSEIMTGYKHRKYLVATPGKAAGGKGTTLTPKLTLKLTLKHKTTSK